MFYNRSCDREYDCVGFHNLKDNEDFRKIHFRFESSMSQ